MKADNFNEIIFNRFPYSFAIESTSFTWPIWYEFFNKKKKEFQSTRCTTIIHRHTQKKMREKSTDARHRQRINFNIFSACKLVVQSILHIPSILSRLVSIAEKKDDISERLG